LTTARNIWGQSFNGTANINGDITATTGANYGLLNFSRIELSPSSNAGFGGYIDFHYNGSTADFTSRIIEGNGNLVAEFNSAVTNSVGGLALRSDSDIATELYFQTLYNNVVHTNWTFSAQPSNWPVFGLYNNRVNDWAWYVDEWSSYFHIRGRYHCNPSPGDPGLEI